MFASMMQTVVLQMPAPQIDSRARASDGFVFSLLFLECGGGSA